MRKKIVYLVAGGALVALLQWAVPASYSVVVADDEAAQVCPADASSCPLSKESADVEA